MPKMIETFRDKVNLISAPLSDLLRDGYAKLTKRGHGRVYAKITFEVPVKAALVKGAPKMLKNMKVVGDA
jgi:hypothetical protein